ncbi:hypothetical protein VFPFJ_03556 [Purpureocillium lilacinum]|uniref:Uncharacterized protein n=1 Tax=Purpureocillium lilacinum TaxID=33203 RepID=A0A179HN18_PURLI|nr:hypothetical protein VFPFJ_03556 [Purpureocillium lilacinum]OAQ91816.1 hypothetical protein VFPFJ_03556 [Purpureocillium lilacinum]
MPPKRKVADVVSGEAGNGSENESDVDSVEPFECNLAKKMREMKQEHADELRLMQNKLESAEKSAADARKECQRWAASAEQDHLALDMAQTVLASISPDQQMELGASLDDASRLQLDHMLRRRKAAVNEAVAKAIQEHIRRAAHYGFQAGQRQVLHNLDTAIGMIKAASVPQESGEQNPSNEASDPGEGSEHDAI